MKSLSGSKILPDNGPDISQQKPDKSRLAYAIAALHSRGVLPPANTPAEQRWLLIVNVAGRRASIRRLPVERVFHRR
jgi:hypothetical protein